MISESHMTWEYRTLTQSCEMNREVNTFAIDQSQTKALNALGSEGWELVTVVPLMSEDVTWAVSYVFKRPAS